MLWVLLDNIMEANRCSSPVKEILNGKDSSSFIDPFQDDISHISLIDDNTDSYPQSNVFHMFDDDFSTSVIDPFDTSIEKSESNHITTLSRSTIDPFSSDDTHTSEREDYIENSDESISTRSGMRYTFFIYTFYNNNFIRIMRLKSQKS